MSAEPRRRPSRSRTSAIRDAGTIIPSETSVDRRSGPRRSGELDERGINHDVSAVANQSIFNAGERLGEPVGDPSQSAVAALRGFSYQLHASALAWIGLGDGELLYLEVAEDYAIVTSDALRGVQVKDDAGSGSVTIRSAGVIAAIDSLVDLTRRNAGRRVSIRYLTTPSIGRERAVVDRIEDGPSLSYCPSPQHLHLHGTVDEISR